jgi:hypothetical protein
MRTAGRSGGRASVRVLAAVALLGAAPCAWAAEPFADPALYEATAVVTGTDMRQRPLGFAEDFTEVLVKVSGAPRLEHDPAVAALARHADRYASSFSYVDPDAFRLHNDDQGTYDRCQELTVHFDPARIDAAFADMISEAVTLVHGTATL